MIHPAIVHEAKTFAETWSLRHDEQPILKLDYRWPTVGVVDLLTQQMRGRAERTPIEDQILRGAAAYLSVLAHDSWSSFGTEVVVEDSPQGIVIRAVGGYNVSQLSPFSVAIEKHLRAMIARPTSPFSVLVGFDRPITPEQNIVSLFAIGLCMGLCPYGEGVWLDESVDSFSENIEKATKLLAVQCAEHYARVYPDEPWGQVAELYLNRLIYPPALLDEDLPAIRAVRSLLDFFTEFKVKEDGILKLASNLAKSADDTLANAGLMFVAALSKTIPPQDVLAAAQSKGMFAGLLRPGMLFIREQFKQRGDWLLQDKFTTDDRKRFEIEVSLNFLPWIKIPATRAGDKKLQGLLTALSVFDLDNARKFAETIGEETPGDIDVRLQRVYLDIIVGDHERAEKALKSIISEPGAELNAQLYDMWGLCDQTKGDLKASVSHHEQAYKTMDYNDVHHEAIANNYAWALMLNDRFSEALDLLSQTERRSRCPITIFLNKAYCYAVMSRFEESEKAQQQALHLAPLDIRVFANLMAEREAKLQSN